MNTSSPDERLAASSDPIHPATLVRRALLASATELDTALSTARPQDHRRHSALDRWFAGFAAQVRRHQELLDAVVVPTLAARGALTDEQLDELADDHSWIDDLLSDLGDAIGVLSFGLGAETWWLGKASDLAATLRHVLQHQLAREEAQLTPLVATCLDDQERLIVDQETVRAVATGPVPFSLDWLHAHITDAERRALEPHTAGTGRLDGRRRDPRSALAALR